MLNDLVAVYSDPTTLVLTGHVPFILMVSATLAFPISFALVKLYRYTVLKTMAAAAAKPESVPPSLETSEPSPTQTERQPEATIVDEGPWIDHRPDAEALCTDVSTAPWWAVAVHGAAGAAYAVVMTCCYLAATGMSPVPMRCLFLFWIYMWPVVLAANLLAVSTRRAIFATVGVYGVIFVLICMLSIAGSSKLTPGQLAFVWTWMSLPATLLLLGSLHRSVRAVGPLVVAFVTLAVAGTLLVSSILSTNHALLRAVAQPLFHIGLSAGAVLTDQRMDFTRLADRN